VDGPLQFIVYVAVKYLAYSGWCALGVNWLDRTGRSPLRSGLGFGLIRLLIGVAAGVAIFFIGGISHWSAWPNLLLQYLAVYAPVRWFEWGIMELLIVRERRNLLKVFLIGGNGRTRMWRLGGILVSHLADIPMILTGGGVHEMLPIGRFLC
jgi:hypothetical protein